ncbi:MAG: hypothetical protein E4G98_05080 [Promethearchaeota archaeon]|nr:MAG: hypothetical protein E4G98_05080 [Candidatus Lokiarchaeota archaeon]
MCSEFADLFISNLRAGGISGHRISGYAIDLDHLDLGRQAWCEYFSPRLGYIQCDPTLRFLRGISTQHVCRKILGVNHD